MNISVVLPAKDEEVLLQNTVNDIETHLKTLKVKYEIIIIENGSTDKTLHIARRLSKKNPTIKVVHIQKASYGDAIISGIKKASGKYVVIFNVDFWNKEFLDITKNDLNGYDIVLGSKNLSRSTDNRSVLRKYISRTFSRFLNVYFNYSGTDTHGLKTMRRKAIMEIVKMCKTTSGIFDTELMVRAQRVGLKIKEIPVSVKEIRPNRFGLSRILYTPKDILKLKDSLKTDVVGNKNALDIGVVLLILISFLIYLTASKINFHWIDDGWMLEVSQRMLTSLNTLNLYELKNILVEGNIGRFRPVFWLWKSITFSFAGYSAHLHYLFRHLLFLGIAILIYKTVCYYTKDKISSFFAGSLFLLSPLNTENLFRLGPQEPLLGFLIMLSLFVTLVYKKPLLGVFFYALALLSKETSIAFVAALTVYYMIDYYVNKKGNKEIYVLLKYTFFLSILMLTFTQLIRSGYSTNYEFSILDSAMRFGVYFNISKVQIPLLTIMMATFIMRWVCRITQQNKNATSIDVIEILFAGLFVFYLAIQSPWIWVMERYMLPAVIGAVVFIGIEFSNVKKIIYDKYPVITIFILMILGLSYANYIYKNIIEITNYGRKVSHSTNNVQSLFKHLAENSIYYEKVYYNLKKSDATQEHVKESIRQIKNNYDRPNIDIKYLEDYSDINDKSLIVDGSGLIPKYYEKDALSDLLIGYEKVSIVNEGSTLVILEPIDLFKQLGRKGYLYIFNNEPIYPTDFYANFIFENGWDIYYPPQD